MIKPHVDIDSPEAAPYIPFAQRQITRLKRVSAFGHRHWNFSSDGSLTTDGRGDIDITVWWGGVYDRIKITSNPGKQWRDIRSVSTPDSVNSQFGFYTRFYRGKGENISVTNKVFTNATQPPFNFTNEKFDIYADANWSKDGKTFVSMRCDGTTFVGSIQITRGDVTVSVPDVLTGIPSTIGFFGRLAITISQDMKPINRPSILRTGTGTVPGGPGTIEMYVISEDGMRVIMHSSKVQEEAAVIADWDEDAQTFHITRVPLPPEFLAVVSLPQPPGPLFDFPVGSPDGAYYVPNSFPWGGFVLFSAFGQQLFTQDQVYQLPILHYANTDKFYYYFRATTQFSSATLASGSSGAPPSVPFAYCEITGLVKDRMMKYDVRTRTWSEMRRRDEDFIQVTLIGNTGHDQIQTPMPDVIGQIFWNLFLQPDGTEQLLHVNGVRHPAFTQLRVIDGSNTLTTVATVTIPGQFNFFTDTTPVLDDGNNVIMPDCGLTNFASAPPQFSAWRVAEDNRCLYRTNTGLFWRWGTDSSQIMTMSPITDGFMDKTGRWFFSHFFVEGNDLLAPRVYLDGVLVWDSAVALADPDQPYSNMTFSGSSTEREGFAATRLIVKPDVSAELANHAMASFVKSDQTGLYELKAEKFVDSQSWIDPEGFNGSQTPLGRTVPMDAIAEECFCAPIRTAT